VYPPHELEDALLRATRERGVPGIAVAVGTRERVLSLTHTGLAQRVPEEITLPPDAVWDLASLTKVIATTTSVAILASRGKLDFGAVLSDYLPEVAGKPLGAVTLRQLLTHVAGLPAWVPLYELHHSYREMLAAVYATDLETPAGAERRYSDLGFILLGEVVHRASGQMIDRFTHERIFGPLGMHDTCYNPDGRLHDRCAATELDPATNLPLVGVVHDENARAMGGVSGHAGVFSTASDLARFAQALLALPEGPLAGAISDEVWGEIQHNDPESPAGYRRLGWDGVWPKTAHAGIFSPSAYGHSGFTGTAIWVDPGNDAFVVVLTNAVHPSRKDLDERSYPTRMEVCRAGMDLVAAARVGGSA
jgi:serine-type D-Ala-D-Ala carboxypeptidase